MSDVCVGDIMFKQLFKFLKGSDRFKKDWESRPFNLVRVRFELDNGEIRELRGEEANDWWHDIFLMQRGGKPDWNRHKFKKL